MTGTIVTRLPTAVKRKVVQRSVKAVREYKCANPWPGKHEFGPMREQRIEADRKAAIINAVEQTPAMLLVHAMLGLLAEDHLQKIAKALAPGAAVGRQAHVEALTLVQTARMTVGEQLDLFNALDRLNGRTRP